MEKPELNEKSFSEEKAEICPDCGNIYRIILLKESDNYNDFGYRHCPFCGLLIDQYA